MKLRVQADKNVVSMFIVGAEGYMLSKRMKEKYPDYLPKKRNRRDHPFVLVQPKIPESYGGYIPGAPGTVEVEQTSRRKRVLSPTKKDASSPAKVVANITSASSVTMGTRRVASNEPPDDSDSILPANAAETGPDSSYERAEEADSILPLIAARSRPGDSIEPTEEADSIRPAITAGAIPGGRSRLDSPDDSVKSSSR